MQWPWAVISLLSVTGNAETDISGAQSVNVAGNIDTQAGESLKEKIAALRKSVATGGQQIMGLTVHIDSEGVNTLSMMLETIILLAKLAAQCASHSHSGTGTPTNATTFTQTGAKARRREASTKRLLPDLTITPALYGLFYALHHMQQDGRPLRAHQDQSPITIPSKPRPRPGRWRGSAQTK